MTEHELQLLISGIGIGFQLAIALFLFWEIRDSRREQKRAAAVLAEARAHLKDDTAEEVQ
ncbi:hypothetical protein PV392_08260 [Streptomyces sp. ME03-5709C]|nr:hypothetical protein [Streptomyces sp. ME03-5709C]